MKNHTRSRIVMLTVFLLVCCHSAFSSDPAVMYREANDLYKKEKYSEAIQLYNTILKQGYKNSEIYYNLGNAYYKSGEIAPAVLNYERALKLAPQDEDLQYNLKLAYMQTVDKIEPVPLVFYQRWWQNMLHTSTVDERARISILLFFLFAFVFIAYLFFRNRTIKMIAFFMAGAFFITASLFLLLSAKQHATENNRSAAIVFSTNEYVKSSPQDDGKNLFMLHEGTKVLIMDQLQGWYKIKIANGNQGWIESGSLQKI